MLRKHHQQQPITRGPIHPTSLYRKYLSDFGHLALQAPYRTVTHGPHHRNNSESWPIAARNRQVIFLCLGLLIQRIIDTDLAAYASRLIAFHPLAQRSVYGPISHFLSSE